VCALPEAFRSPGNWRRLERAIAAEHADGKHGPLPVAVNWMDTYGQRAKAQIATRDPTQSTPPARRAGPARDRAPDRQPRRVVHHRARLAKLLDLITLDMTGKADGRDWPTACARASTKRADGR